MEKETDLAPYGKELGVKQALVTIKQGRALANLSGIMTIIIPIYDKEIPEQRIAVEQPGGSTPQTLPWRYDVCHIFGNGTLVRALDYDITIALFVITQPPQ